MSNLLDLSALKDGMSITDGIVYISSYKRALKKDGGGYILGTFTNKDDSVSFKVWDSMLVDYLSANDLQGRVAKVTGSIGSYQGNIDVKITSIQPLDETEYPKSLFLKSADVEKLFSEFTDFINNNLSQKAVQVVLGIFKGEDLFKRFKEEFAGSKMHDAQVGGLLNHTMKMLRIAKCVVANEPRFSTVENYSDLLYTSIIFHDMGKVFEMNLGVYQENSFVTHRILGIEVLVKYKAAIIQLYDENFYYELVSVLQGHHGEFGDKPNTVLAFIVHLIDLLESQVTGIFDKIERNEYQMRAGNMSVFVDGNYLVV